MNFKQCTAALLISGCLLTGCSQSHTVKKNDKYVVSSLEKGNKEKNILADDLYKSILNSSNGKTAAYNAVLQNIIDKKFPVNDEIKTDADTIVQQVRTYYKNQYGSDSYKSQLKQVLQNAGYSSMSDYRQKMIKQIQYANFLLKYVDKNYDSVFNDYYKQCSPRYVSIIKVSMADVSNPTDTESKKLNEVKELLSNTDKSFGSIAQGYSDDDSTKSKKGSVGIVDSKDTSSLTNTYGSEVIEKAQSLNAGETSDAIAGSDGYYFVKVTSTDAKKLKKELKDTDIDSPLLAYDDYLQYIVFNSYKITYKDKKIKKNVESVVNEALKQRQQERGEN